MRSWCGQAMIKKGILQNEVDQCFFLLSGSEMRREPVCGDLCILISGGESPQQVLYGSAEAAMLTGGCGSVSSKV